MPDPRQPDHKLNKEESVSYRYSVILVEVQSGVVLQLAQQVRGKNHLYCLANQQLVSHNAISRE